MVIYGHRVAIDAHSAAPSFKNAMPSVSPFSFALPALPRCRTGTACRSDSAPSNTPHWKTGLTNCWCPGTIPRCTSPINAAVDDLIQSGPHQSTRHCRDHRWIRNYQFNADTRLPVLSMESIIERSAQRFAFTGSVAGETNQASVNPSSSNHDLCGDPGHRRMAGRRPWQ